MALPLTMEHVMSITPGPEAKAYIFLNGDFDKPNNWPDQPKNGDLVIAADGGGRHLKALNWEPHCLVGDFDSLDPTTLAKFKADGAEIFKYPVDKNEIDFELALELARLRGHNHIEVLGALGGRWDMTFANLFLPLADWGVSSIKFRHGSWTLMAATGPVTVELEGTTGDRLSLIPLGNDVRGITIEGCLYPLNKETLYVGLSRGLSNEFTSPQATVSFESGTLLLTHQGVALD